MACVEDSIDDLFTEEDCCWKWDVPVDQHFAPGKDIGVMTYAEMYAKVNEWHMKAAGTSLCVHCRMPRGAKPGADDTNSCQGLWRCRCITQREAFFMHLSCAQKFLPRVWARDKREMEIEAKHAAVQERRRHCMGIQLAEALRIIDISFGCVRNKV